MTTLYFEEVIDEEAEIEHKDTAEAICSSFRVKQLPLCPHPIGGGASLTLIDNKAYIFGGCSREGVPSNSFSYFDFDSNDWVCHPACHGNGPSPRFGHSAVAFDSKLYIFGGQGFSISSDSTIATNNADSLESFSSLHYLDLETMEWCQVQRSSSTREQWPKDRNSQGSVLVGSNWVFFGGANEYEGPMDDFWLFDLEKMVWHDIKANGDDNPCAREMHTLCCDAENKCVYLLGGRRHDGEVCQDFWIFDFATYSWTELDAQPPSPRCAHTAIFNTTSRSIDVIGGWDGKGVIFDDCISYNIGSGDWTTTSIGEAEEQAEFSPRFAHCSCLLSTGQTLIAGGVNVASDFSHVCIIERN